MNWLKQLNRIVLAGFLAVIAMLPVALAYDYGITVPNTQYWNYQTRIGSYSTNLGWGHGFYNYVSPPVMLRKYGANYHWGSNVRWSAQTSYPARTWPSHYTAYAGYPYRAYGNPYWESYRYYAQN